MKYKKENNEKKLWLFPKSTKLIFLYHYYLFLRISFAKEFGLFYLYKIIYYRWDSESLNIQLTIDLWFGFCITYWYKTWYCEANIFHFEVAVKFLPIFQKTCLKKISSCYEAYGHIKSLIWLAIFTLGPISAILKKINTRKIEYLLILPPM